MFPSSHDITELNINECKTVLKNMLIAGNKVLIVSKPKPECIETLCTELARFKDQVLFRFTIGSADNAVLKFWEPGAPTFEERMESLRIAREHGFDTSVSCEPMLDNHVEAVVLATLPLVTDAIWIGIPNRLTGILSTCKCTDEEKARGQELTATFTEERIKALYGMYKDNPKIKWKESIKKIVGLDMATEAGLDI